MKSIILILLCSFSIFSFTTLQAKEASNAFASEQLKTYAKEKPAPADKKLLLVYFIPSDRKAFANYEERIERIMTDIQVFYRKEMDRNGFGPMTFDLERDTDEKLQIHLVNGEKIGTGYGRNSFWQIRNEIRDALKPKNIEVEQETLIVFQANIEGDMKAFEENCPYAGSGKHNSGIGLFIDFDLQDTLNLSKTSPIIRYRGRRYNLGQLNTTFIGGIAHELGHALGVAHRREKREEKQQLGTALMGGGNYTYRQELRKEGKGSFITPATALQLASHPLFSKSTRDVNTDPQCKITDLNLSKSGDKILVKGKLNSRVPAYCIIAFNDATREGEKGWNDYDSTTWTSQVNENGEFEIEMGQLHPSLFNLRLLVCHLNGATATFRYEYRIDKNGNTDFDPINRKFILHTAIQAVLKRDKDLAQKEIEKLRKKFSEDTNILHQCDHLERLINPPAPLSLAEIPAVRKQVFLSELKWDSAKVGWMHPTRDRVPHERGGETLFLESKEKYHQRGLYAHAPSRYEFELDGKWKFFKSSFAFQKNHIGSVQYVILKDDREVIRSKLHKHSPEVHVMVDLKGAKKLVLIVEDGGDSNRNDWAVWLSPQLVR